MTDRPEPPIAGATEPAERRKLVDNEQIKLTATYLNGVAVALLAVGGLAPIFADRTAIGALSAYVVLSSLLCFAGSLALHLLGRRTLKDLL